MKEKIQAFTTLEVNQQRTFTQALSTFWSIEIRIENHQEGNVEWNI